MKNTMTKLSLSLLIIFAMTESSSFAQGWQGQALNKLIAINAFDNTLGYSGSSQVDDIHVGIGTNTPDVSYKAEIFSNYPNSQLGIAGTTPTIRFSDHVDWASSTMQLNMGFASSAGDFVGGSAPGDFVIQNWNNYNLIFANGGPGYGGLERMRIDRNGYVGINTGTPVTDRLHVLLNPAEFVRIQNMPTTAASMNTVVIDPSGRLYEGPAIPPASIDWHVTGNTIGLTEWLGTINQENLRIKTNSVENITVVPAFNNPSTPTNYAPNVGINTYNAVTTGLSAHLPSSQYKFQVYSDDGDDQMAISGSSPCIRFSNRRDWLGTWACPPPFFIAPPDPSTYAMDMGLATHNSDFVHYAVPGDFIIQNRNKNNSIIFGTDQSNAEDYKLPCSPGTIFNEPGAERVRIDSLGYFGVNTVNNLVATGAPAGSTGTGVLDRVDIFLGTPNWTTPGPGYTPAHNCYSGAQEYVRIQNMPIGGKYIVTIDDLGRLYRCNAPFVCPSTPDSGATAMVQKTSDLQKQVDAQSAEITALKAKVDELLNCCSNNSATTKSGNQFQNTGNALYQNVPNPFTKETSIGYLINQMNKDAAIMISDMNGRQLSKFPITQTGNGNVVVPVGNMAPGMYLYTLIVDGNPVDTKKMIVNAQ